MRQKFARRKKKSAKKAPRYEFTSVHSASNSHQTYAYDEFYTLTVYAGMKSNKQGSEIDFFSLR